MRGKEEGVSGDHCPSTQELLGFQLGNLGEESLRVLAEHLEDCGRCQAALQRLDATEDPFLLELRGLSAAISPANAAPSAYCNSSLAARLQSLAPPSAPAAPQDTDSFPFLAPPEAPDELGWLGPFRILELLGKGGMGLVFRAVDTRLQRPVALKVLRPELAAQLEARQRFLREARAMAALKSEHIVTVYQVDQVDGTSFLAMELLDGLSLEAWLAQGHRPTQEQLLRLACETAQGLAVAHAAGLIHRDVKPANLWLEPPVSATADFRVKVLDFGLALPSERGLHLTQPGFVLGTPAYMSPEQACGDKLDARTDLYSLGCVLYRAATGQTPFQGPNVLALLSAMSTAVIPPVRALHPGISPPLADLIQRLLDRDPNARPASARELLLHLQALAQLPGQNLSLPAAGPRAGEGVTVALAVPAVRRPRSRLLVGAMLTVAGCVGLVVSAAQLGGFVANPPAPTERATPAASLVVPVPTRGPEQVQAVADRLRQLNPGFDGAVQPTYAADGTVVGLRFSTDRVANLAPLAQLTTLRQLTCDGSDYWKGQVSDLTPLRGLRLTELRLRNNQVQDLTPLQGMPLTSLDCCWTRVRSLAPLRGLPLDSLYCCATEITSLEPLRGLSLTSLNCGNTRVPNLEALRGLPLRILICGNNPNLTDLAPLQGMRLEIFNAMRTQVSDYAVLRGMPLYNLAGDFQPERDAVFLRSFSRLVTINDRPAAEFWRKLAGGEREP